MINNFNQKTNSKLMDVLHLVNNTNPQNTENPSSFENLFGVPEALHNYLLDMQSKHQLHDFTSYLNKISPLSVLVVGETIIDEYCYCETIGKSGKEPILAAKYLSSEKFAGGVLAIANHLANFCSNVGVLSFLGTTNSHQDFINGKLNPGINKHFLFINDEPTIIKRRFVETYPLQKLFEVYEMNNCRENSSCDDDLCATLEHLLPQYDVVVAADYGHGMIDTRAVEIMCNQAKFLAVNTQMNAENRGFNTISKYKRADYICISEGEIRLEARNRTKEVQSIILNVAERLSCPQFLITQGSTGCLTYRKGEGFHKTPAFTQHYVDRIGAGDAVLGITSPLVKERVPMEMIGLIGNVIGALAVAVMGNKEPVQKEQLVRYLEHLFALTLC